MTDSLILASSSRYRHELLARLGMPFTAEPPEVDETPLPGEPPAQLARRLARDKALAVAATHPRAVVIGSDQLCCVRERILGKPGTRERAIAQLQAMSGKEAQFLTAVAVAWRGGARVADDLARTRVVFRSLDEDQIRGYVAAEKPLDCSGSFKVEGLGIALFRSVSGDDPTALVGLPLIRLCTLLARAGVEVLPRQR